MDWVMDLIFKDGTSVQLVPAINFTIFLILATVCALMVNGYSSIHIQILAALSIGLLASLNWFIHEFNKVKKRQGEEERVDKSD